MPSALVDHERKPTLLGYADGLQPLETIMADTWLSSLITATPQEGFELAILLSRRGVKYTQPDMETLKQLRPEYAQSADGLTAASQVIAINFQTISAANNYWRG